MLTRIVSVVVPSPEAAARHRGLPIEPGPRLVSSAVSLEKRKVLGGTVILEPVTRFVVTEGIGWLEDELVEELFAAPSKRNPKGRDADTYEKERLRLVQARASVKDDAAPPLGTRAHDRYVDACAELFFGYGVSEASAVAAIGLEHADRVVGLYREGSPSTKWAEHAAQVEREYAAKMQREAEERAAREAERAKDEELVPQPGVARGFDAVLMAPVSARQAAPQRWQWLLGTTGEHELFGVSNMGIRPERDREVTPGVWLCRPDSERVPAMSRRATRAIPVKKAASYDLAGLVDVADLAAEIDLGRTFDARAVREDEYRDLRDPATEYAIECAMRRCDALWPQAFGERFARVRALMVDEFRGRCVHPKLAVGALEKEAKKRFKARFVGEQVPPGWTHEAIDRTVGKVYSGVGTRVTPGSLVDEPPPTWIDKYFRGRATIDPLRDRVTELVDGKPEIKGAELEAALEAEGYAITPTLRQRLHGLLVSLGLAKGRVSEDGKSARVWRKRST